MTDSLIPLRAHDVTLTELGAWGAKLGRGQSLRTDQQARLLNHLRKLLRRDEDIIQHMKKVGA